MHLSIFTQLNSPLCLIFVSYMTSSVIATGGATSSEGERTLAFLGTSLSFSIQGGILWIRVGNQSINKISLIKLAISLCRVKWNQVFWDFTGLVTVEYTWHLYGLAVGYYW